MRLKISFIDLHGKDIVFPVHDVKYLLHYLTYNSFSEQMANKLYLEGFPVNGRKFKLFTISDILEKGVVKNGYINFGQSITFYFSSPLQVLASDFGNNALRKSAVKINEFNLYLREFSIMDEPNISGQVLAKTLSPIVEFSTFVHNEKKITHYYYPTENEFKCLIEENARKKYIAIKQAQGVSVDEDVVKDLHLDIEPYRFSQKRNERIVYFKHTVIKGYTGVYRLTGSPELIKVTYDAGLGAKSSEGFGMWEIWNKEDKND
jgi:CRISPR-associated endoribonuclease Cas6